MSNKIVIVLICALSLKGILGANVTAGTSAGGVTAAACGATPPGPNCAFCDAGNTFCVACNPGYQLSSTAANGPSLCTDACVANSNCLFCTGSATPSASQAITAASSTCQAENQPVPSAITYANAICKNTTTSGVTLYATPGTVTSNTYPCYSCFAGCMNCRPADGNPPASASAASASCRQCIDGTYLDGNTTTGSVTTGTACTLCNINVPSVSGSNSNSAFIVVGICTKCYNKTTCAVGNGTCTRFLGTTAGQGSSDTTSYKYDYGTNTCVPSKSAAKLMVAFVGIIAFAVISLF